MAVARKSFRMAAHVVESARGTSKTSLVKACTRSLIALKDFSLSTTGATALGGGETGPS